MKIGVSSARRITLMVSSMGNSLPSARNAVSSTSRPSIGPSPVAR